jgi:hypothetical protein
MKTKLFALALAALLTPAGAMAALYKCGSAYQDRPCDNGQPQQELRPSGGTVSTPSSSAQGTTRPNQGDSLSCGEAAEQAQRIAWKRESGIKRETVVGELKNRRHGAELVALVHEVYSSKVAASEIRRQKDQQCSQRSAQSTPGTQAGPGLGAPDGQLARLCKQGSQQLASSDAMLRTANLKPTDRAELERARNDLAKKHAAIGC